MGSSSQAYPLQQYQNLDDQNILSIFANGVVELFNNVTISTGDGSPNGVVTANVGSVYLQIDATGGANTIWMKLSGTGNTGWALVGSGSGGSNATSIQGIPVSPATPTSGQTFVYNSGLNEWIPGSGSLAVNHNIRYTTDFIWAQTGSPSNFPALTAGVQATITLTPCPAGIDASGDTLGLGGPISAYSVYISGVGTAEPVKVTGGTCTPNAASGTIIFTPFFNHATGYTIGTASSGIQEAINDGCGAFPGANVGYKNGNCCIVLPPNGAPGSSGTNPGNAYDIFDTVYFHAINGKLVGNGAAVRYSGRGPCLQIGHWTDPHASALNVIEDLAIRVSSALVSNSAYAGNAIVSAQRIGGVATITTAAPHNFRTGDQVTQMFLDDSRFWGDVPFITVTSPTTYTYNRPGSGDIALINTPGCVALTFVAILDNAQNTYFKNVVQMGSTTPVNWNQWFDIWDDEACTIAGFNNDAVVLNSNINWMGSFVFSGGPNCIQNPSIQFAPVITIRDSSFTINAGSGVTVYNSNGVYIDNCVFQAQGLYQFYISNETGNFQGIAVKNIYSEAPTFLNPGSPSTPTTPWPGLGNAGMIIGPRRGAGLVRIMGNGTPLGSVPQNGSGATQYCYFIVAKDNGATPSITDPIPVQLQQESAPGIHTVSWPRFQNGAGLTITYDLIRIPMPLGLSAAGGNTVWPYTALCTGGSVAACGSVATAIPQCAGLVCTFNDDTSLATTAYAIPLSNNQSSQNLMAPFIPGPVVTYANFPIISDQTVTGIVTVWSVGRPSNMALFGQGTTAGRGPSVSLGSPLALNNGLAYHTATILQDGTWNGGASPSQGTVPKGRLNILHRQGTGLAGMHFITLCDSQSDKTLNTSTQRPNSDPADSFIGCDVISGNTVGVNQIPLSFGAPVSISFYINNVGDGVNFLERLTAAKKQFNVVVQHASVVFAALPAGPVNGMIIYCSDCNIANPCTSGGTGAFAKRIAGAWVCN